MKHKDIMHTEKKFLIPSVLKFYDESHFVYVRLQFNKNTRIDQDIEHLQLLFYPKPGQIEISSPLHLEPLYFLRKTTAPTSSLGCLRP